MRLVRVQVAPLPRRRAFQLDIAPNRPPAVLDGSFTLSRFQRADAQIWIVWWEPPSVAARRLSYLMPNEAG